MTAEEKRRLAAALMQGRAGQNQYTQGAKRGCFFGYPREGMAGFSDCSSAVRACIRRAAGIDIGSNTDRQLRNYKKGLVVDHTQGILPDEAKLKPGDCLYFKGNSAHFGNVGHVEMYTGKNECWGHGSGIGPTKKDLAKYCRGRAAKNRRYFCAIRWILDETEAPGTAKSVFVTARGTWRIREKPGIMHRTIAFARQGDELEYISCQKAADGGKWVQVRCGQGAGWISYRAVKRTV